MSYRSHNSFTCGDQCELPVTNSTHIKKCMTLHIHTLQNYLWVCGQCERSVCDM